MRLRRLEISTVGGIVLAAAILALMIQRRASLNVREKEKALRRQQHQLAELAAEGERL